MKEDSTGRIAFGKRLARKRKQMKLTQEELAIKAGLDRVTINRIENGKFNVGLDILNKIGTALGAELDYADVIRPWDTKFYDRDTKQEITEEEYVKRYSLENNIPSKSQVDWDLKPGDIKYIVGIDTAIQDGDHTVTTKNNQV